jgi:hypothetical protein
MVGMIEPRRSISGQNLVGKSFQVHFAACRNDFVGGANWFHSATSRLSAVASPVSGSSQRERAGSRACRPGRARRQRISRPGVHRTALFRNCRFAMPVPLHIPIFGGAAAVLRGAATAPDPADIWPERLRRRPQPRDWEPMLMVKMQRAIVALD